MKVLRSVIHVIADFYPDDAQTVGEPVEAGGQKQLDGLRTVDALERLAAFGAL